LAFCNCQPIIVETFKSLQYYSSL